MTSMSKSAYLAEVYSDDDYLPSSPGLQPFYPSWPQQEKTPDVDSDGDEEDIVRRPWRPLIDTRNERQNADLRDRMSLGPMAFGCDLRR